MVTALVSTLTQIPIKCKVAMTGEITLRGEVTAIGGLKEKLLAALRGGIETVLIPEENVKDLAEIPDNVKNGLEIIPVKWIDQVLKIALEREPQPFSEEQIAAAAAARGPEDEAPLVSTARLVYLYRRGLYWRGDLEAPVANRLQSPAPRAAALDISAAADWRGLKLERELWRSSDFLGQGLQTFWHRRRYYTNLLSPSTLVNKVSIWLPNHLIPGWAFVTPYTSRLRYTAVGKVDIALIVVFLASLGSVFSAVNYTITYRYIGAPILKGRRELRSFFVDALLVGSRMMILANPALLIGILLLLSDRHMGTSVFDFSGGGDTILFQHLFWFFGHPEVYIIIIPCFGFMNSLLPYYLRKRLSGRLSLQFSMYTIAFMGFAVWGHHMYMVGLANSARTLYSTMTVMISVPASTKVLHWCVSLIQSSPTLDVGFCFLLSFMYFFVLGGLSGMFNAHIGFNVLFHDTFYVIGHFHVMLAGAAMSCVFAGFYFYFAAIFGVRYSRFFAYLHFIFYLSGQLLTLIPMF